MPRGDRKLTACGRNPAQEITLESIDMAKKFAFKGYRVTYIDSHSGAEAVSVSKQQVSGRVCSYQLSGPAGLNAVLEHATWSNGEADVRCREVSLKGSEGCERERALKRLERGSLRLGIYPLSAMASWAELRQARFKPGTQNYWSNLFSATEKQLIEGAGGLNVGAILQELGAEEIGTKAGILETSDNTRQRLCVTFGSDNPQVPIAA